MPLWIAWFDAVRALRPACRRFLTFLWMILVLVGLCCRPERAGVTSLVRLFGFGNLVDRFHNNIAIQEIVV
jgi:hypothetical protein